MASFNVLVVEDNSDKRTKIITAIQRASSAATIDEATCIIDAKKLLTSRTYDLMVLDIALPNYPNEEIVRDAGANLLREIQDYDLYGKPKYVIGVTGFKDLADQFEPQFSDRFWRLIHAEVGADGWEQSISSFVEHLSKVYGATEERSVVDLCILTALRDPELDALLALPWDWQKAIQLDENTFYHLGSFQSNGKNITVAAGCSLRMGPVPASVLACKFIAALRPRLIGMIGICAGVRGEASLGDIVAASEVWSWESGKLVAEADRGFLPEPISVSVSDHIVARVQQLQADRSWLDSTCAAYKGNKPNVSLNLHIAPIASGSPVVSDSNVVDRIRGGNRKTVGIEMEAFGVLFAARNFGGKLPLGFCLKSVSDFADEHKDDSCRHYSAYTSARTLFELFNRFGDQIVELSP